LNSIRKKLLRWLLVGQFLALVMACAINFIYVRSELKDMFDEHLRQLAFNVPEQGTFVYQGSPPASSLGEADDEDVVIQIWQSDGHQVLHRHHKASYPAMAAEGYSTTWAKEMLWRNFVLRRGTQLIQVSQPLSEQLEMSSGVAIGAIAPVLVSVVMLSLLVWFSVLKALKPMQQLTHDLNARRPFSLDPLEASGVPDEVQPMVNALNTLLQRLGQALDGQRKFIADAAHELRTPLAAVQLQVHVMQRSQTEEKRDRALNQIRAGVSRASHLVHQLLTLARMEPEDWQRPFVTVDLGELVRSVVADHTPTALHRQIDLGVTREDPSSIYGEPESLRIMLGNLVDNALRYTPVGGRVDVSLYNAEEKIRLEVQDTGRGIPPEERSKVFSRFYRRPGTRESGSGLGLAIVQEIANRHQGEVVLTDGEGGSGLRVIITFTPFKNEENI